MIGEVAQAPGADSPRASGTLEAHYAPRTPMLLLPQAALRKEAAEQAAFGKRVGLLALERLPGERGEALPGEARAYAHGLYAALRALDAQGHHCCWWSGRRKAATGWR